MKRKTPPPRPTRTPTKAPAPNPASQFTRPIRDLLAANERFKHSDANVPSDSYVACAVKLVRTWCLNDPPPALLGMRPAVADLAESLSDAHEFSRSGKVLPGEKFYAALELLERKLTDDRPPLESMQTLRDQKVPDWQIASVYGLVPDGEDSRKYADLVQRELDKPGSVIGPDWVDPRDRDPVELTHEERRQRIADRATFKRRLSDALERIRQVHEDGGVQAKSGGQIAMEQQERLLQTMNKKRELANRHVPIPTRRGKEAAYAE